MDSGLGVKDDEGGVVLGRVLSVLSEGWLASALLRGGWLEGRSLFRVIVIRRN